MDMKTISLTFSVRSTPYGVATSKVEMTEVHHLGARARR
jgi:hypothetical protein